MAMTSTRGHVDRHVETLTLSNRCESSECRNLVLDMVNYWNEGVGSGRSECSTVGKRVISDVRWSGTEGSTGD